MQSLTRSKRWQMVAVAMAVLCAFAWMQYDALSTAAAASHALSSPDAQGAVWTQYSDDVASMLEYYTGIIAALVGLGVLGQTVTDAASKGETSGNSPTAIAAATRAMATKQKAKAASLRAIATAEDDEDFS